jgi:hypothetical protein
VKKTERLVDHVRAAWNQHDALCFASLFSDDALLRIIATGDVMHGREQIQQFAEAFLRAFPDLRIDRRSTRLQRGKFASSNGRSRPPTRGSSWASRRPIARSNCSPAQLLLLVAVRTAVTR